VSKDARIPKDFTGSLQNDTYRPLQSISYAVSYSLWGLNADLYRTENILIHITNGLLLYLLLLYLFKRRMLSFLAAFFFLVHPVQIEAVTYLSGRADVLALFFYLLSFLLFIKSADSENRSNLGLRLISLVCFFLGILAKEMAATLPFIILLYLILCKMPEGKYSFKGVARTVWPYFCILLVFMFLRTVNLERIAQMQARSVPVLVLTMVRVFGEYMRLLFFPAGLSFFREVSSGVGGTIFGFFAAITYIYLCWKALKINKVAAFFLIAYSVALLPVSNIIPLKSFMQERFLY